jgi:hypothetical protein
VNHEATPRHLGEEYFRELGYGDPGSGNGRAPLTETPKKAPKQAERYGSGGASPVETAKAVDEHGRGDPVPLFAIAVQRGETATAVKWLRDLAEDQRCISESKRRDALARKAIVEAAAPGADLEQIVEELQDDMLNLDGADLTTFRAADILAAPEEANTDWRVEDVTATGEAGLLVADSGVGKSFALTDYAVAAARGDRTWLGRRLHGGRQRVLYLSAEGGIRGFRSRLQASVEERGPLPDDSVELWIPGDDSLDLLSPTDVARIEAKVVDGKFDILIADPLSDLSSGDESNDSYRAMWRLWRPMLNRTGVNSWTAHHARKPTMLSKAGSGHEIRGGTALKAGADAVLILEPDSNSDRLRLTFDKVRNAAAPPPALLERRPSGRIEYLADAPTKQSGPRVTSEELVDTLREHGREVSRGELADLLGVKERTLRNYLSRLPDDAPIRLRKDGPACFYQYAKVARWGDQN